MNDLERASQVYQACLSVIPHSTFSFSKIWIYAAKLFVRRKDLKSARKLLGRAIGLCGKEKIFTEYVALELALGEVDRCRNLYTNYLKAMPHNCRAWSKYAELEKSVGESEVCDTLLVNAYRLQWIRPSSILTYTALALSLPLAMPCDLRIGRGATCS